jgi:hypothetical protein
VCLACDLPALVIRDCQKLRQTTPNLKKRNWSYTNCEVALGPICSNLVSPPLLNCEDVTWDWWKPLRALVAGVPPNIRTEYIYDGWGAPTRWLPQAEALLWAAWHMPHFHAHHVMSQLSERKRPTFVFSSSWDMWKPIVLYRILSTTQSILYNYNASWTRFHYYNAWKNSIKVTAASYGLNESLPAIFFFAGSTAPLGPGLWFFSFMISLQTVGLLGRGISPSQGLYLNTGQHKHRINTYSYQTSMPCVGFEHTIPASERAKTVHDLDRSAVVTALCAIACPNPVNDPGPVLLFLERLYLVYSYYCQFYFFTVQWLNIFGRVAHLSRPYGLIYHSYEKPLNSVYMNSVFTSISPYSDIEVIFCI